MGLESWTTYLNRTFLNIESVFEKFRAFGWLTKMNYKAFAIMYFNFILIYSKMSIF